MHLSIWDVISILDFNKCVNAKLTKKMFIFSL